MYILVISVCVQVGLGRPPPVENSLAVGFPHGFAGLGDGGDGDDDEFSLAEDIPAQVNGVDHNSHLKGEDDELAE